MARARTLGIVAGAGALACIAVAWLVAVALARAPRLSDLTAVIDEVGRPLPGFVSLTVIATVLIAFGLRRRREDPVPIDWTLRRLMASWGLDPARADERVVQDVIRSWARLSGAMLLGGGAGLLVATALFAVGIALGLPSALGLPATVILPYLTAIVASPVGYAIGVREVRRAAAGRIAYADLRERRPDDYRSPALRWLPALMVAALAGLSLVVVGERLLDPPAGGLAPAVPWVLGGLLAGMAAVVLLGELAVGHVATIPRLVVTEDAASSRRADDMLRSYVILSVQALVLMSLTLLGVGATAALGSAASGRLPDALLVAILAAWLLLVPCAAVVWASGGRLGGRINGWPWSTVA